MDVDFIGYPVEFRRQIFYRGAHEEDVRSATLSRFSMNFFGDLLEWTDVRVDPDVELVRILTGRLVYKEPVARPDVDYHSLAGKGQ